MARVHRVRALSQDVVVAIAETAFLTTDFPVILSFENHCSKANQLKMAKYCVESFGDMLLTKPLDGFPVGDARSATCTKSSRQ